MSSKSRHDLRAWWSYRQALDGRLDGSKPVEVLRQTGWARSVGGVAPYLTLFARAGLSREAVDKAAAALEIQELPAARGCTYVVPACDFALAVKNASAFGNGEMKVAAKLGVTEREIEKLADAVLQSLAKAPLDPDNIRETVGRLVRNLGEEGKKKGLTTTLPVALEKLQSSGEIRRVPVNGRLDQQRYRYALWRPNPVADFKLSREEALLELARRYFTWIGPATLSEFQWFCACSAKVAKTLAQELKLETVNDDRLLLPEQRDEWEAFAAPKLAAFVLVASIDGITLLRRDLASLVDESELSKVFLAIGTGKGSIADPPSHCIFDRGRLIGLWEYDTESQEIVWASFASPDKQLKKAIERTEEYVKAQLGDARSFSLDSPKSRAPRIEALRAVSKTTGKSTK